MEIANAKATSNEAYDFFTKDWDKVPKPSLSRQSSIKSHAGDEVFEENESGKLVELSICPCFVDIN